MFWYYVLCVVGMLACFALATVVLRTVWKQGGKSVIVKVVSCFLAIAAITALLMVVANALECGAISDLDFELAMELDNAYATWKTATVMTLALAGLMVVIQLAMEAFTKFTSLEE